MPVYSLGNFKEEILDYNICSMCDWGIEELTEFREVRCSMLDNDTPFTRLLLITATYSVLHAFPSRELALRVGG